MRKVLFVTAAFLTIIFLVSPSLTAAQKKWKFPKHSNIPQIDYQAEARARDLWSSRITRCGADYYTRDGNSIYQFKNSRITVTPTRLTTADKLNGVEYSGYTHFTVGQSRSFSPVSTSYQNAGWSRWYDGFRIPQGGFSLGMYLRKENGYWRATPFSSKQLNNLQPVDCWDRYASNDDFLYEDDYYQSPAYNNRNRNSSDRNDNPYNRNEDNRNESVYYNRNDNRDDRYNNFYNRNQRINWISSGRGQSVPSNAIVGGVELGGDSNGATLYVCRANYNGGWYPGKLLNGSCNIGFGGKEVVFSTYEIATGSGQWGKARAGNAGALMSGRETERAVYVCRANFRESSGSGTTNYGQYPGRVVDNKCNFAFGTKELSSSDFDVFYPNPSPNNNYSY